MIISKDREINVIKSKKHNIDNKIFVNKSSLSQFILIIYNFIFLPIVVFSFILNWDSVLQLPKASVFIIGVSIFLFIASVLWIFGFIQHKVSINLGDIIFILLGISIAIIAILNGNNNAFWGSTVRIFDSGLFILFLTLFYILNKVFLENESLHRITLFFSILIILGGIFAGLYIYVPIFSEFLPILKQLQPTGIWLTESPQELILLTIVSLHIIFTDIMHKNNNLIIKILYCIAIMTNVLLVIRIPSYTMYVLLIITLIIHNIVYINNLYKNINDKSNIKLNINKISFIYGFFVVCLIALMLVRPFKNDKHFPEYPNLVNPSIDASLDITKKSLKSDTWFGAGSVKYAWDRYSSLSGKNQISNFSFETLFNEIFNLVVRYGMIIAIIMAVFGMWLIFSFIRIILIQKVFPLEIYTVCIMISGLFLIQFSVITKIFLILSLVLWNNIFTKYFRPLFRFELDTVKMPSTISSLLTFVILFTFAGSAFIIMNIFNLFKSQEYVLKASQIQDKPIEQIDLLKKAKDTSPNYMEYANLYIPQLIQRINQQALELAAASQQSGNIAIDSDKQKLLQDNINDAQKNIDDYKKVFPSDSRVLYWQLDLYSVIHNYGDLEEKDYLSNINKGRELQPNVISWDIYQAQYYAKQAQKGESLNSEQLEKAKVILSDTIERNQFSIEAYKNYYDLLALKNDYKEQINILNQYINITIEKELIADQSLIYNLALAYQNDKQYDVAIAYYNKLLETFPEYTNVYFRLGEIYEIQQKNDLAIQNYQKVVDLDAQAEEAKLKLEKLK